jgi:hypothetical protein
MSLLEWASKSRHESEKDPVMVAFGSALVGPPEASTSVTTETTKNGTGLRRMRILLPAEA